MVNYKDAACAVFAGIGAWIAQSPILISGGIGVAAVLIMLLVYAVVRVFDR